MFAHYARQGLAVAIAGTLFASLPVVAPPARAEVIYLKNGTQIKGKITKQDEETFDVLTNQGNLKIAKHKVALVDVPNPTIAAGLGAGFPGAGQAYVGRWDKAAFYLVITAITFGTAFVIGMFSFNGSLSAPPSGFILPVVSGTTTALIPMGLGAYDAFLEALRLNAEPKFKIEYGESL